MPAAAWMVGLALVVLSLGFLGYELRRRRPKFWIIELLTGAVGAVLLLAAMLRPQRLYARELVVKPRGLLLVDRSRSMELPREAGSASRFARAQEIAERITKQYDNVRWTVLGFGDGSATPLAQKALDPRSDLTVAVNELAARHDEPFALSVVVSDGRLEAPEEHSTDEALKEIGKTLRGPVSMVSTSEKALPDASVRRVSTSGTVLAHATFPLHVEVACAGGLTCDTLPVTVRELGEGTAVPLASGDVKIENGVGAIDLSLTLDRVGTRILEVGIAPPSGDIVVENNVRLLPLRVARERVRVLHVAGRPTNDVRALRQWLKSNGSIDLVSFFILRTQSDNPRASNDELSLIPFPVDELFTKHLPSFDAVVLQDFDAQPYGLMVHLPNLTSYVKNGGGLVMFGGPNSFSAGGYARSPLVEVLPVELETSPSVSQADASLFKPDWTDDGRRAPLLAPVSQIARDDLPEMSGSNVVGDVTPGALALWVHPARKTVKGNPMPVLAVGEFNQGRSIALTIDGAWTLGFSPWSAPRAGRGYAALLDGLLGWIMRDPRYESFQLADARCIAGESGRLRIVAGPLGKGGVQKPDVRLRRLDAKADERTLVLDDKGDVELPALAQGAYEVFVSDGKSAAAAPGSAATQRANANGAGAGDARIGSRLPFACERGGDEWADTRPAPDLLKRAAKANGGKYFASDDAVKLDVPEATFVSTDRIARPVLPPWVWSATGAFFLGIHWIARRKRGLP